MTTPFVPGQVVATRFGDTDQIDRNGKRFISPRQPVPHDFRIDDLFHVWSDGEWLDLLAFKYYGDPALWWVIADFNGLTEMRQIDVGRTLRLPDRKRLVLEILAKLS